LIANTSWVEIETLGNVTHPIEVINDPHLVSWVGNMVLNDVGVWVTDYILLGVLVSIVRELKT